MLNKDENKFNNINKIYSMFGGMGQTEQ